MFSSQYFGTYRKPSLYAYADVSSWWSKSWSRLYLHPYFVCASSESFGEILKIAQAYWIRGTCNMY